MDSKWVWAAGAVVGGVALGSIVGLVLRRVLGREGRRPAVREIASPASLFAFWLFTATGIVVAVAMSSPATLEPVPRDILNWLPNAAVAGLFLIAGYAVGLTLSAALGGALTRASGQRRRWVERLVRGVIVAGSAILALDQVGVDTTILHILIGAAAGGLAAALAGVAIMGSRHVAADVAAGRVLQRWLSGATIESASASGAVVDLGVTHAVIVDPVSGRRRLVPYSVLAGEVVDLDVE